ncbi:MAG: tetratricopeptide repeat protein, partial [Persicimonas sp.]
FDTTVRDQIVDRAGGNPLFAIQLVNQWVEREWLEEGPQGLIVADGAETPANFDALWQARIEAVCEAIDEERCESVRRCLEIGAALGLAVEMSEWQRACDLCQVPTRRAAIEALASRGLVRAEEEAWHFEYTTLHDALVESSKRAGRWEYQNQMCARALEALSDGDEASSAHRRAHHLVEAGQRRAALGPLLVAADAAYDRGEYALVESLFEERRRIRESLEDELDSESDGPELWRRARLAFATGDLAHARELVRESIEHLTSGEQPAELGRALFLEGRILRDVGELDAARTRFEDALEHFAHAGDEDGLVYARASLGYVELMQGETSAAREHFEAALEVFEDLDYTIGRGRMHTILAYTSMSEGDFEIAEHHYERALEVTRRAGDRPTEAEVLRSRGELARRRGDLEGARAYTMAALDLHELSGARTLHATRFGLALIELGLGRFDAAAERLDEAESSFAEVGYEARLPVVYAAQMACAAARGEWRRCDGYLDRTRAALDETGVAHEDIAWSAESAADHAREAGRQNIARRARRIARQQRDSLGSTGGDE